jgi:hypothetical protein
MRSLVRWGCATTAAFSVLIWLFVALFVCDWSFNLSLGSRCVALATGIVAGIFATIKLARPFVTVRESLEEIALIVERHRGIDSDLVAALQFEQSPANGWESSQLASALVDRVATSTRTLDPFEKFSFEPLPRRLLVLVASLLIVIGGVISLPEHAIAFWNRMQLRTTRYPTKTVIDSITINGQTIQDSLESEVPKFHVPFGKNVYVEVQCRGRLTGSGIARMTSLIGESLNQVQLPASVKNHAVLVGELTHLVDSFRVTFQCGDARSHPVDIIIVPLPMVDVRWEISPPEYAARSMKRQSSKENGQQLTVLEGSTAILQVVCPNKQLSSAWLTVGESRFELVPSGHTESHNVPWTLSEPTRFTNIREALTYEIQVIDRDGLSFEKPIKGQIRLKSDRRPRIVATAATQRVLPTAQPKVDFIATDDFGISMIMAIVRVSHEDGRSSQHEVVVQEVPDLRQPKELIRGQVTIPLSSYELSKGDEVHVTLEATDWRGAGRGEKNISEPITLNVTDINGILLQIGDEDKKSAKQLEEILRREIAVGRDK